MTMLINKNPTSWVEAGLLIKFRKNYVSWIQRFAIQFFYGDNVKNVKTKQIQLDKELNEMIQDFKIVAGGFFVDMKLACKLTGYSASTIRRAISLQELQSKNSGNKHKIYVRNLARWMQSR